MPKLSERRLDAWTALAAEPAVRAAERAIVTGSSAVLADTLAVSTAAESRRRLAHVLELKDRADRDSERRDAYQRAADDLRRWAANVYLAALREPGECLLRLTGRPGGTRPTTTAKPRNSYTEESISLRRSVPRPPFPGQRRRRPFDAGAVAEVRDADRMPRPSRRPPSSSPSPSSKRSGLRTRAAHRRWRDRARATPRSGWSSHPMAREPARRNAGSSVGTSNEGVEEWS